ncbi:hypothetical protein [Denitrificimonas caeni]|uniref:hypothetical protein n=1 Tax=Denitrificimonas caeni TaxID=521720 RepID=UPI001964DB43|nr:hypothetical protein [Denitrificimonas caeni]
MMKKSLTQAIALATAIVAGASAHAANVNQDGHGEVLLYPVYTAENGNVTAVSVTNTTAAYKAVKVRFVEGMNSKEVLDFNLYLSPYDVWSGAVTLNAAGNPVLVTQDNSCTAGQIPTAGQPFVNFEYGAGSKKDVTDAKFMGLDRARVGHVELIEMGELPAGLVLTGTKTVKQSIEHVNGVPGDCNAVRNAFNAGGIWATSAAVGVTPPTGGLYGTAAVVNVDAGWQSSYDAVAVDNTIDATLPAARHYKPGSTSPNFSDVFPAVAFKDGSKATVANGYDAVSAILMKENIQNDYIVGAALNAQTDMVITFPTKRHYVNGLLTGDLHAVATPFTAGWNKKTAQACEKIQVVYTDNEERRLQLEEGQFSPQPEFDNTISLCHETNIFSISGSNVLGGKFVQHNLALDAAYTQGWIDIDFTAAANGLPAADRKLALIGHTGTPVVTALDGLPVIGHSVIVTQNGDVGGLLSNYGATFDHKATTTLDK